MKKLIRNEAGRWGLTVVISIAATTALIYIIAVVLQFLPDYDQVSAAITSPIGSLVQQIIFSALMLTLPYIIVARSGGQKVAQLIKVSPVRPSLSVPLITGALGASMVINMLMVKFNSLFTVFKLENISPQFALPDSPWGIALYIVTLAVVPAVLEEFAFRGIILGSMRRYGSAYAIMMSGLLFGLMHGNFVQIPFAAALGCVLGYLTVVTDSILPAVTVHFFNNLFSGIQTVAEHNYGVDTGTAVLYGGFITILAVGLAGLYLLCRRHKHPFAPIEERSVLTVGESFAAACSSGGVITSFIYFGGSACLYLLENSISFT